MQILWTLLKKRNNGCIVENANSGYAMIILGCPKSFFRFMKKW